MTFLLLFMRYSNGVPGGLDIGEADALRTPAVTALSDAVASVWMTESFYQTMRAQAGAPGADGRTGGGPVPA